MQAEDGAARSARRVSIGPRSIFDGCELFLALHLQQRDSLRPNKCVKNEQLQLNALPKMDTHCLAALTHAYIDWWCSLFGP